MPRGGAGQRGGQRGGHREALALALRTRGFRGNPDNTGYAARDEPIDFVHCFSLPRVVVAALGIGLLFFNQIRRFL